MANRYKFTLTQSERIELTQLTRCGKTPAAKFLHARAQSFKNTHWLLLFAEETRIAHATPGGTLEKALSGLSLENRE